MYFDLVRNYYKEQGCNIDGKYNFFYDETNNNIKFQFKNDKIPNLNDFVNKYRLGGIVLEKDENFYDLNELKESLNLKGELKINLVNSQKTDTFLNCLRGKKLEVILDFLIGKKIFIHVFSFDNLYDVIIEIVDSLIMEEFIELYEGLAPIMKNELYKFVLTDLDRFMKYLYIYKYPNVEGENIYNFCNDMYSWIDSNLQNSFGLECCRQLFKSYRKKDKLLFLSGNKDNVIIDGYAGINFDMCIKFCNSFHFFDDISSVKNELVKYGIDNYSFGDSMQYFTLQLSDVVVGLLDRFYSYLDSKNSFDIMCELNSLRGRQAENLKKFLKLYNASVSENEMFFGFYEPIENVENRNSIILMLIERFLKFE